MISPTNWPVAVLGLAVAAATAAPAAAHSVEALEAKLLERETYVQMTPTAPGRTPTRRSRRGSFQSRTCATRD
ncbi:MAG: hypothetical protein V3R22_02000 [Kiloniellales bacterium]